jgi:hypothetical protein
MLNDIECTQIGKHIVSWVSNTGGFKIFDVKVFASEILPKYFANIQYKSFIRQINIYGFRRVQYSTEKGTVVGAYVHPLFVRNQPELCWQMRRTRVKGPGMFSRTTRAHNQIGQHNNAIAIFGAHNRVTIDEPPQQYVTSSTATFSSNEQYNPWTPSKEEETSGKFDVDVMSVQPSNDTLNNNNNNNNNVTSDPVAWRVSDEAIIEPMGCSTNRYLQPARSDHHSMKEMPLQGNEETNAVSSFYDDCTLYFHYDPTFKNK